MELPDSIRAVVRGWLNCNQVVMRARGDNVLWENGMGFVWPEEGANPYIDAAHGALSRIEGLDPRVVVPGHGEPFSDAKGSVANVRSRLAALGQGARPPLPRAAAGTTPDRTPRRDRTKAAPPHGGAEVAQARARRGPGEVQCHADHAQPDEQGRNHARL